MKLITPEAILSYPSLFTARPGMNGGEAKFGCTLVFPPGTDLTEMRKAAMDTLTEKYGDKTAGMVKTGKLKLPFRADGDEKGYPEGSIFINVRSKTAPGIVDAKREKITDPAVIYPGSIVRASVASFAYDTSGNKGVTFFLNNIQKVRDGARLDGRRAAEDEFDIVEDPSIAEGLEVAA